MESQNQITENNFGYSFENNEESGQPYINQEELLEKNRFLEDTRRAVLNVLEDMAESEEQLRKKKEEIEKEKEQAESILRFLKSIGDGVVATDMSGKIIFFNEAAEKLTQLSGGKVLGKNITETLNLFQEKEPEKQVQILTDSLKGGEEYNSESKHYVIMHDDGESIPVSFSASPIYDMRKNMQGFIIILHDVTHARELERTKDNFLSVAAHQLRTPLSGIRWSLEMLIDGDAGEISKEALEMIKEVNENTNRLVVLVNDLLDISRINSGKANDPAEPTKVAKAMEDVLRSLKSFINERKINVIFEEGAKSHSYVIISPKRFFEAIENIVSNAIKYTHENGKVEIGIKEKNESVTITVRDNGIGIPQKEQEKVFSKFFRAQNATRKETEGSGLGLNVTKSFIEEAGGKVSFESTENKGTVFYITMPSYIAS